MVPTATDDERDYADMKMAQTRAKQRDQRPAESRLDLAMEEVAHCRSRCDRAAKHAMEAIKQKEKAEALLQEAEANLVKVHRDMQEAPSPASQSSSQ